MDGQTQPGTTDWLTVFIDDQVTVKLRGHAATRRRTSLLSEEQSQLRAPMVWF
jgi:hypothetical protein